MNKTIIIDLFQLGEVHECGHLTVLIVLHQSGRINRLPLLEMVQIFRDLRPCQSLLQGYDNFDIFYCYSSRYMLYL